MSDSIRPRRSVLYMPGSNARALEKAKTLAADALILDLEDAVAPEEKVVARERIAEAIIAGGYGERELVIRINGMSTPWGVDDLEMVAKVAPDAILVPKVSSAEDIYEAGRRLSQLHAAGYVRIWAMMETPLAMLNAREIAAASAGQDGQRFTAMVMGTNDLAKDTRARFVPGRTPMLGWLSTCVAAARAYGLDVIDGVYSDLRNDEGFREECRQGRDLGMDGKTLIHPNQIAPCNTAFAPSTDEVNWARTVIAAFEAPDNPGKGAIKVDGRMVELLHAEMAKRTVAIAEAIMAGEQVPA